MPVPALRRRSPATLTGLLLAALLLAGQATTPTDAAAQVPAGSPGARGIGDPYYPLDGNGGYDVAHYDVEGRYDLATGELTGSTELTVVAKQRLSRFNLDLVLTVDAVEIDGVPVGFVRRGGHEVQVTPAEAIARGTRFQVRVEHHGRPDEIGFRGIRPWFRTAEETMVTNEPQIAPWWFAANDHPRDRASFDITLSVPEGNEVISNGELVASSVEDGWSTWHWRLTEPIPPYLAFFAAGRFELESGVEQGLPYTNAVSEGLSPVLRERSMRLMGRSAGVVRWMEKLFGPYPYSSTGGVTTSLHTGFALENASRPTYPYLGDGGFARAVLVHEIAHQWFGNHVAVGRWRDIWLNEGFATWAEWRYDEAHGGRRAQLTLENRYNRYGARDGFWDLRIGDPGPQRLFDQAVYERGAMTVQALRHRIGNRDFSRLVTTWLDRRGNRTGRVPQFRRLAEKVSGEQLDGFFDAWLNGRRKPARTAANGLGQG